MTLVDALLAAGTTLSFEFFPPKTENAQRNLEKVVAELATVSPSFVSVTCGAGGQPHDRTAEVVADISRTRDFPAMAHLTCVGHTRAQIEAQLAEYAANGVRNILALAGDPPADGSEPTGDFRYAIELVELIRSHGDFCVAVAAHPEVHPRSPDRDTDRRHLAEKLELADLAITQFFFDPDLYARLVDELAVLGNDKPIVPGVFPVTSPAVVRRFAGMNAAAVPEDFFARVEAADAPERHRMAVEAAVELSQALLDRGAPGVHLYTMNRSEVALDVVAALGLRG